MKKVLFFLVVLASVACEKEILPKINSEKSGIVEIGGMNSDLNFDSIVSPIPSNYAFGAVYNFELYPDLRNNTDLSIVASNTWDTINGVVLNICYITIVADYTISQIDSTIEIMSTTQAGDSLAILTSHTNYPHFQNILSSIKRTYQRPTWFSKGGHFDINSATWVAEFQQGIRHFTEGATIFARQLNLDEHPANPNYSFTIKDLYYPLLLGQQHKFIVFKCMTGTEVGKQEARIGWIELSLDLNANLTIHKVVYQVD